MSAPYRVHEIPEGHAKFSSLLLVYAQNQVVYEFPRSTLSKVTDKCCTVNWILKWLGIRAIIGTKYTAQSVTKLTYPLIISDQRPMINVSLIFSHQKNKPVFILFYSMNLLCQTQLNLWFPLATVIRKIHKQYKTRKLL